MKKGILKFSTIQLLRIPFSFFLMPVFWFALSQLTHISVVRSVVIFFILHLMLYPGSNAYNSFMDRDTESIGGVKNPLPPTTQLYHISILLDAMAIATSLFISIYFVAGIVFFIAASKAYSYRGIRLKKYPVTSFLLAATCQGGLVFFLVYHGCSISKTLAIPVLPVIASSLLVGSVYPLTQIYQHRQDEADGVKTISSLLGYKGTFIFTAITYSIALIILGYYFASNLELVRFLLLIVIMTPVLIYFFWWYHAVIKNTSSANFKNSLRMNIVTSLCTNAAFITLLIIEQF